MASSPSVPYGDETSGRLGRLIFIVSPGARPCSPHQRCTSITADAQGLGDGWRVESGASLRVRMWSQVAIHDGMAP